MPYFSFHRPSNSYRCMGKSYIKSEWMRKHTKDESERPYSGMNPTDNPHKFDEMPKNRPSKYVSTRCGSIEWIQEEPSRYSGHKSHSAGHRIVSGIVRAKNKKEIMDEINNSYDF